TSMSFASTSDEKDFHELLVLLENKKAVDVVTHADHIWKELVEKQNSILDSLTDVYDTSAIGNIQRTLGHSKNMLRVLQALTHSLEERTMSFERRMARAGIKNGIGILPFDIISKILANSRPTFKEAVGLSHVNSQFRQAMLSSPVIWSSYGLHTYMSSEQIASLASRIGARSLTARISSERGIEEWEKRVDLILSLNMRLKKLEIEDLDNSSASFLQTNHSKLHMPVLEDLAISYHGFSHLVHFYASWSLESVTRLEVTDFIPMPIFGRHLSYCHLKFTRTFTVESLADFITGLPSLKTLKIELVDIDGSSDDEDEDEDMDVDDEGDAGLGISSITCYSFSVIGQTSISFARRVLIAIHPPNVAEMSFSIVYPSREDFEDDQDAWWRRNSLLTPVRQFSKLKILNLHFSGPDSKYSLVFSTILLRMPHGLESIRLEAPGHRLDMYWLDDADDYETPRLHTLRFSNCDGMQCSFLEEVRKDLLEDSVQIEKLEVIGCPFVKEEKLRAAFPTTELVWVA
ncbi:hypothetical protein DFH11DRAFT_1651188, partial [Phellopilus nigrolimitatus]